MIQGGDPTGTGRGGTSIYGQKLCVFIHLFIRSAAVGSLRLRNSEDEIHPELRFTGAGILAMANSGPNTNGRNVLALHLTFALILHRLSILHHSGSDTLPRQQTHHLRPG